MSSHGREGVSPAHNPQASPQAVKSGLPVPGGFGYYGAIFPADDAEGFLIHFPGRRP
jgi:hypothetical protein